MHWIAHAHVRCCRVLPAVAAAVWLWSALALAGEASDWLTGPALVKKLDSSQQKYEETADRLAEVLETYRTQMHHDTSSLDEIVHLLRAGFRLTERDL